VISCPVLMERARYFRLGDTSSATSIRPAGSGGPQRLIHGMGRRTAALFLPVRALDAVHHLRFGSVLAPLPPRSTPERYALITRSATRPVQPVWWEAPSPAPVSPWKYSWNGRRPCQAASVWKRS